MKKYLLLAGVFTLFTSAAQADGWYGEREYSRPYQNNGYYEEAPRYIEREAPRYRQISPSEARRYRERQYTRSSSANTYTTSEDTNQIRPYIGVDVAMSSMDFGDDDVVKDYEGGDNYFKDKLNTFSIVGGAKFNKNFGIEVFYQKSGEEENKVGDGGYGYDISNIEYSAYGLDFQRYIPIDQEFEILASLGLAQYDFETTEQYYMHVNMGAENVGNGKHDFDSLGVRLGIGAQYNLTEHIALRGMARYTHMTDDEYIKSITEFSLGLRYMF